MDKNRLYSLIESLPGLVYTGGIDERQIAHAEAELGLNFAEEYICYLSKFGQMEAQGIELTGISNKTTTSVVNVTKALRQIIDAPSKMYVIEDLGIDGIVYLQDIEGLVYQFRPRSTAVLYAKSLFEYINKSQNK